MSPGKCKGAVHTVVAADVTAGTVALSFADGAQVQGAIVRVSAPTGVVKAWDGATTISEGIVTVDNAGTVGWVDGDVITVVAF